MKLLIVVDMQNDFVTGSLGTKEAQAIVENVVCKIKETPAEQIYVTQDTHPEQYLQTKEGLHLPVAHCIEGTDGHCLCPAVEQALEEKQVDEADVIVDAAACACVTPASHDTALAAMKLCQIEVEKEGKEPWRN